MKEILNLEQFLFYGDKIIEQEKPLVNRIYSKQELQVQESLVRSLMDEKAVDFSDEQRTAVTNEYAQKLVDLYIKAGEPGLAAIFPFALG
jgi:hypothetical protein